VQKSQSAARATGHSSANFASPSFRLSYHLPTTAHHLFDTSRASAILRHPRPRPTATTTKHTANALHLHARPFRSFASPSPRPTATTTKHAAEAPHHHSQFCVTRLGAVMHLTVESNRRPGRINCSSRNTTSRPTAALLEECAVRRRSFQRRFGPKSYFVRKAAMPRLSRAKSRRPTWRSTYVTTRVRGVEKPCREPAVRCTHQPRVPRSPPGQLAFWRSAGRLNTYGVSFAGRAS
jgi:hypothetical protein